MQVLRLDGFLLLSLPLPGLGIHCSFSSWIQLPSRTLWEGSCDGSGLKVGLCRCSVSMVSFYYLSLSLSLSLTPANSSQRSIQFQCPVSVVPRFPRSVSVASIVIVSSLSLPHLLFYSLLVLRFRFGYPVVYISGPPSFDNSLFHLVSLTRHLYNMSPIVTFLPFYSVSGF